MTTASKKWTEIKPRTRNVKEEVDSISTGAHGASEAGVGAVHIVLHKRPEGGNLFSFHITMTPDEAIRLAAQLTKYAQWAKEN